MSDPQTLQEYIEDLFRSWDADVDLTAGSSVRVDIIDPLVDALGADAFSMPILDFIVDRVKQEYPSLDMSDHVGGRDLFAKPLVPVLAPLRGQIDAIRQRQSFLRPDLLTDDDADGLAANWFASRNQGEYVTVTARVYYAAPAYQDVSPLVRFYTNGGLNFYPTRAQTITAEQMTVQRSGSDYYMDVVVRSENPGTEYEIDRGELSNVEGIASAIRVVNLDAGSGGVSRENNTQLITKTKRGLSERSLTGVRGIFGKLTETFSGIRNLEVVGMGDPEMERDVITGGGHGSVRASGTAFVFGTFCLLLSQYEDRGLNGLTEVEVGDTVDLNYWGMLYGMPDHQQHEEFTITSVVFSSRDAVPSFPTIYLFQMNGEPTPTSTILGGFPGLLPAVFTTVRGQGKIEIADIPGGILAPETDRGTIIIDDGEIHIGGKHDIWVRPASDTEASTSVTAADEQPLYADRSLSFDGLGAYPNIVMSTDPTIDWVELGVIAGQHFLVITEGADAGSYGILRVSRDELVLDTDMTTTDEGVAFRIVDEVVVNLVEPRHLKVPFGAAAPGGDLQTFVGQDVVRFTGTNLLNYQAATGDILRILEGPDAGDYEITSFDTTNGGSGPQVDRPLSASNANLDYEVFTPFTGIDRPLVRLEPLGVRLLDAADQPTEVTVPPALPIDSRNLEGFTGAAETASGTMGFVMPDLTPTFEPLEDVVCSRLAQFGFDEFIAGEIVGSGSFPATTEGVLDLLDAVVGAGCYGDGCIPCDGYTVCLSFDADGIRLNTSLTPQVATYWNSVVTWLEETYAAFFPSKDVPDVVIDEDGIFAPWPAGQELTADHVMQVELCLPAEFFNCCNDVFMAIPEVSIPTLASILAAFDTDNWPAQIAELGQLLDGAEEPALCQAEPGDVLTIASGPNAGGYNIRDLHTFTLQIPIVEIDDTDVQDTLLPGGTMTATSYYAYLNEFWGQFNICAVTIRGEFSVGPCGAFWNMFQEGLPDVPDLPEPPAFDGYCYDDYGNIQDPFDWIVAFFAWLIEFLGRLGFDIPEDILDYLGLENILLALADMVFVDYSVGSPTCDNIVRVYFSEPTTIEVDSGGECTVLLAEEVDDVPITIHAGQPTLWSAVVGAEEALYTPSPDADPHQVFPSKESSEDTLEQDLPRDLEVVSQGTNSQLRITDMSVPAPIELMFLEGRDFVEIHEELFCLPSERATGGNAVVISDDVSAFTPPETEAVITSDAITFPYVAEAEESARVWSEAVPPVGPFVFAGGEILQITVNAPSIGMTATLQHSFAAGNISLTDIRDELNADAAFTAGLVQAETLNSSVPGQMVLAIRTLETGVQTSIFVVPGSTALSTGGGPIPWNTAAGAVGTSQGHSAETIRATVIDPNGTHVQEFTHVGQAQNGPVILVVPGATYNDMAQLLAEMLAAGFEDDGGTQVLSLTASGNSLVMTTIEGGATVTIEADVTTGAALNGHPAWTTPLGTGPAFATISVDVEDSSGTHTQSFTFPESVAVADAAAAAAAMNVPSFTEDAGVPVLTVTAVGDTVVVASVEVGGAVVVDVDQSSAATSGGYGYLTFDPAIGYGYDQAPSKDRIPAARIRRDTARIEVLESAGIDFVTLGVQAGDLLFLEEGLDAGGYVVESISALELVVDHVMTDNSSTPLKDGNDGSWDGDVAENTRFTVTAGTFDTDDLGRYLTIYGSHYPATNGSYKVLDVDTTSGAWVDLEIPAGYFPADSRESDVLWVLSGAPAEAPVETDVGGTELWGLRPFRLYSGTADVWVVSAVDTTLDNAVATFSVQDPLDPTHVPVDGYGQPFRVIRPGVQRVSSTVMATQRAGCMYYADFLVRSSGSDDIYNLTAMTRMEMVFGTYFSEGYRYETDDTRLTFSTHEEVAIHVSPAVLPVGADDDHASRIPVDSQRMQLRYTWAPLVAQLQRFVTSRQERAPDSDPLVRHFLPSYVCFDGQYQGGATEAGLYPEVRDYINDRDPLDELGVAAVEDKMRTSGATGWNHPSTLAAVTHDLDRRMVADRSEDKLGGDTEVYFNGSNRTSFFIPGALATGADEDIPAGEHIILTRQVGRGVIR